jgi:hypothetical protein
MDDRERKFADYLNELNGDVNICGIDYPAGNALYEVDPTAFRTYLNDWEDFNEEEEE